MVSKLTLLARRRNGKTLTLSRARLRSVLAGRAAGRRGRDGAPRRAGGNGARPALAPHAGRESLTRRTVRQPATATIPILGLTDDAGGATDRIRASDQPQDREDARAHNSGIILGSRRRGD